MVHIMTFAIAMKYAYNSTRTISKNPRLNITNVDCLKFERSSFRIRKANKATAINHQC